MKRGDSMKTDKEMRDIVRKNLIKCRTERELTQTDVGKIVGKSKTAIASWEQGLSMPDIITLYKLTNYYGVTLDFMYGEEQ
jgi:transcriptional regulator with XRE-family HTH domain